MWEGVNLAVDSMESPKNVRRAECGLPIKVQSLAYCFIFLTLSPLGRLFVVLLNSFSNFRDAEAYDNIVAARLSTGQRIDLNKPYGTKELREE